MKCPYCAEEINEGAIVCRFCNHDLQFYTPMALRIDSLEKRLDRLEQNANQTMPVATGPTSIPSRIPLNVKVYFYIFILLSEVIISTAFYAYYIYLHNHHSSNATIFLWISVLLPLFAGIWIGYSSLEERSQEETLVVSTCTGLLASLGVVLTLRANNKTPLPQDVVVYYFLPPFILLTGGGLLGDWLRRKRSGRIGPPAYARNLAEALIRGSNDNVEARQQQVNQLSEYLDVINPFLTLSATLLSIWLTSLAPVH